jgi:hypothetical protein
VTGMASNSWREHCARCWCSYQNCKVPWRKRIALRPPISRGVHGMRMTNMAVCFLQEAIEDRPGHPLGVTGRYSINASLNAIKLFSSRTCRHEKNNSLKTSHYPSNLSRNSKARTDSSSVRQKLLQTSPLLKRR